MFCCNHSNLVNGWIFDSVAKYILFHTFQWANKWISIVKVSLLRYSSACHCTCTVVWTNCWIVVLIHYLVVVVALMLIMVESLVISTCFIQFQFSFCMYVSFLNCMMSQAFTTIVKQHLQAISCCQHTQARYNKIYFASESNIQPFTTL